MWLDGWVSGGVNSERRKEVGPKYKMEKSGAKTEILKREERSWTKKKVIEQGITSFQNLSSSIDQWFENLTLPFERGQGKDCWAAWILQNGGELREISWIEILKVSLPWIHSINDFCPYLAGEAAGH